MVMITAMTPAKIGRLMKTWLRRMISSLIPFPGQGPPWRRPALRLPCRPYGQSASVACDATGAETGSLVDDGAASIRPATGLTFAPGWMNWLPWMTT